MSQLALEIFGFDLYFDIDLAFVLLQRPLVQILGSLCFYPDLNSIENMWGYIYWVPQNSRNSLAVRC
jgi:hypothetical protein